MRHLSLRLALFILTILLPPAAPAAPVAAIEILDLDGGSIVFTRLSNLGTMDLHGARLTLGRRVHPIGLGGDVWGFEACFGLSFGGLGACDPGKTLPVGGSATGSAIFASATLDGVTHPASGAGFEFDGVNLFTAGLVHSRTSATSHPSS